MPEKASAIALKRAPTVAVSLPVENGFADFLLAYDFKAINLVKQTTGKSLLNGNVWGTMEDDPELVSAIVWAGLQLHHPLLSLDDVEHMMLPSQLGTVLPKVREAWSAVQSKADPMDPALEPTAASAATL